MEVGCIDESISDSESEYENQEDVTGVNRKSVWPWLRALAANRGQISNLGLKKMKQGLQLCTNAESIEDVWTDSSISGAVQ